MVGTAGKKSGQGSKILAIETSSQVGSIALAVGDEPLAVERFGRNLRHVAELLPAMERATKELGWKAADLDEVYVSAGPGSFTGLRIGLSAVKAFCFATGIPIVGVNSLRAIAAGVTADATVLTATDARKREIYAAAWACAPESLPQPLVATNTFAPPDFARQCAGLEGPLVGLGNGFAAYSDAFASLGDRLTLAPDSDWWPQASVLARLGQARYTQSGGDDLGSLEPTYIRPSEAEINWKKTT